MTPLPRVTSSFLYRTTRSRSLLSQCSATTILSLDVGTRRTGVACTDPQQEWPRPLGTVQTRHFYEELKEIINDKQHQLSFDRIGGVVVGMPLPLQGQSYHQSEWTLNWARLNITQERFPFCQGICMIDERFTTRHVMRGMKGTYKRKAILEQKDVGAAVLLLETYLAQSRMNAESPQMTSGI